MNPSRKDLLGYLLDALDEAERARIERALAEDPALQLQLEQLAEQLPGRSPAADVFVPQHELAERTCDLVAAFGDSECVDSIRRARKYGPAFGNRPEAACRQAGYRWSLADAVVTAGIFLAVALVFFPAIAASRYRSRINACQHNLQQVGQGLADYSMVRNGRFPEIPTAGNRSAAGVYGPILVEGNWLTDPNRLVCPGSHLAANVDRWRVPSLEELDRAEGRQLVALRRAMGGSYGYTLGYLADNDYRTPFNEGRAYFALMSDAPSLHLAKRRSDNHGGRGQNVLFEDNHIEFITDCFRDQYGDALFVNEEGYASAGSDKNDSVIGRSAMPPLLFEPSVTRF